MILTASPALGQEPRSGGWLTLRLREDLPQRFAIHESATISTMWPTMPCLSNLVLFDPLKPTHSVDTVIGELAERWSWQENYRKLVFFLRKDVRWHDGKPFSSKDVKSTFDMLREAPEAPAKLRLNPRKEWHANAEGAEALDPHTVVFRLKRPQPSLLLMLASGFTPIYRRRRAGGELPGGLCRDRPLQAEGVAQGRVRGVREEHRVLRKGRPYLDGSRTIIAERGTATAALQAGRVDAAFPGETPKRIADQLSGAPAAITPVSSSVLDHLILNTRKPPFDSAKLRQAVTRAIDRRALIAAVYQGGATLGASMVPRPYGEAHARGSARGSPVTAIPPTRRPPPDGCRRGRSVSASSKVEMTTRNLPAFADLSAFLISELKRVGIDASLKLVDSSQLQPLQTRGEFQIGTDRNGLDPDDPDANFYEHYACSSPRNYQGYCDEGIARLIDQQSQELDARKRLALVYEIQMKLEQAAVRPALDWRLDYFTVWPHVKNLVPHHSIYGWGRLQDVWRAR